MSTPFGKSTAPGAASTADGGTTAPSLALVVVWSASQPERVGDVAFFRPGERLYVGRGDVEVEKFAHFVRQLPGETPAVDPRDGILAGDSISRRQLLVRSTGVALEIEQVGRCRTFFNGVEGPRATIGPGDTVMLKGELVLLCVLRPRVLPRPRAVPRAPGGHPASRAALAPAARAAAARAGPAFRREASGRTARAEGQRAPHRPPGAAALAHERS
jgi:hypothetical protein